MKVGENPKIDIYISGGVYIVYSKAYLRLERGVRIIIRNECHVLLQTRPKWPHLLFLKLVQFERLDLKDLLRPTLFENGTISQQLSIYPFNHMLSI